MSRMVEARPGARAARPRVPRRNLTILVGGPPALLLACCLSLQAGPPLETDDPDTPGSGLWEINFASMLEKRAKVWEFKPVLDVNYGWGEQVQLKLKPRLVLLDAPSRGPRIGAGNIQFGVKWRFLQEDKHGFAMSVYPQADFNPPGPSVENGLVDDGHDLFLPVELARTFGRTRLYTEFGCHWREQREDEWVFGVAAEHLLSNRFRVVGELRDIAQRDFDDHELFFNAGFKWRLREHWTLLASAGSTIHELRGERAAVFSYLGLQLTF